MHIALVAMCLPGISPIGQTVIEVMYPPKRDSLKECNEEKELRIAAAAIHGFGFVIQGVIAIAKQAMTLLSTIYGISSLLSLAFVCYNVYQIVKLNKETERLSALAQNQLLNPARAVAPRNL